MLENAIFQSNGVFNESEVVRHTSNQSQNLGSFEVPPMAHELATVSGSGLFEISPVVNETAIVAGPIEVSPVGNETAIDAGPLEGSPVVNEMATVAGPLEVSPVAYETPLDDAIAMFTSDDVQPEITLGTPLPKRRKRDSGDSGFGSPSGSSPPVSTDPLVPIPMNHGVLIQGPLDPKGPEAPIPSRRPTQMLQDQHTVVIYECLICNVTFKHKWQQNQHNDRKHNDKIENLVIPSLAPNVAPQMQAQQQRQAQLQMHYQRQLERHNARDHRKIKENLVPLPQAQQMASQAPQQIAPLQMPQHQMPQYHMPYFQVPHHQIPQHQMPQNHMPQHQLPQHQMPQYQMPQHQTPQYQRPHHQMPQHQLPQPQMLQHQMPQQITQQNVPCWQCTNPFSRCSDCFGALFRKWERQFQK